MADDSMEISSEHGQTAGDDIDIDIDFTAGQVDDDYILQDVHPSFEYGDGFTDIPHDHPMVDDDNASYQMEDADAIHDELIQDAEPEQMSFGTTDMTQNEIDSGNTTEAITYREDHDFRLPEDHDTYAYEATQSDFLDAAHDARGEIASKPDDFSVQDDKLSTDKVVGEPQTVHSNDQQSGSRESTPRQPDPAVAQEETGTPLATTSAQRLSTPVYEDTDLAVESDEQTVSVDDQKSPELSFDLSKARDVKVIYQSVEYTLFSSSDSDDPDSFFLSDISVIEKPLNELFAAIREIIHGDLTVEDELCLNIEDLGLETEEASSTLRDITLGQILSLHQMLLNNEGLAAPGPLYLLLSTRTNFSRRFTYLSDSGAQGKGLSELVIRDISSESHEGAEEEENAKDDVGLTVENHQASEDVEEESTYDDDETISKGGRSLPDHRTEVSEIHETEYQDLESRQEFERKHGAENGVTTQGDQKEQDVIKGDEYGEVYDVEDVSVQENQLPTATARDSDHTNDDIKLDIGTQSSSQHAPKSEIAKEVTAGEDNEDDLIDYSDEEVEFPGTEHGRTTVVDAGRTDTEYQAQKEVLRHRSISRQAEEKLLEEAIDQSFATIEGTEGGNGHTDSPHDAQNDNYQVIEDTTEADSGSHADGQPGLSNDFETFEDDEETYVYDVEGDGGINDDYSGFENLDDEEIEAQEKLLATGSSDHAKITEFEHVDGSAIGHEHTALSTASSLGAVETAESSVTLGAAEEIQYEDDESDEEEFNEQEADPTADHANGSTIEPKDEIDYEDDEDDNVPISVSSGALTATKVPSNINGKRSIAEVESVTSSTAKDAKRPRS